MINKNLLIIIMNCIFFSYGYLNACPQDSSCIDNIQCDGKSYYLKIFPSGSNNVNGIGVKYFAPLSYQICDTIRINGAHIDINPLHSVMGALAAGISIFIIPGHSITKIMETRDNLENNEIFRDSTFEIYSGTEINGISLSISNLFPYHNNGINVCLLYGEFADVNGLSISGFISTFDDFNGISFSLIYNKCHNIQGTFISGIGNSVSNGKWFSFAGLYNESVNFTGVQIGLFNFTKKLKGIQLGLWNSNGKRSLPLINWQF